MRFSSNVVGPNTKMMKFEDVSPSEAVTWTQLAMLFPDMVKVYNYGDKLEVQLHFKEE